MSAILRQADRTDVPDMQVIRMSVKENQLISMVIPDEAVIEAIEKTGRGWVVEEDDTIVGFGIANQDERNIWALFLHPDCESRGHGRKLLDAMTDWLWSLGDAPLWLSTDPGTRAEKFYEKAGWVKTALLDNGEVRFEQTKHG